MLRDEESGGLEVYGKASQRAKKHQGKAEWAFLSLTFQWSLTTPKNLDRKKGEPGYKAVLFTSQLTRFVFELKRNHFHFHAKPCPFFLQQENLWFIKKGPYKLKLISEALKLNLLHNWILLQLSYCQYRKCYAFYRIVLPVLPLPVYVTTFLWKGDSQLTWLKLLCNAIHL